MFSQQYLGSWMTPKIITRTVFILAFLLVFDYYFGYRPVPPATRKGTLHVFIDGGAANGNSYRHFRKNPQRPWGIPEGRTVNDFQAYLMEVNPYFNRELRDLEIEFPHNVHSFIETAVFEEDRANFTIYLDTTSVFWNFWGSSMFKYGDDQKVAHVRALGLARWLLDNFKDSDYVIVKLDIEGAEYGVIHSLIKTGAYKLIDQLVVEWHAKLEKRLEDEHPDMTQKALETELRRLKVNYNDHESWT